MKTENYCRKSNKNYEKQKVRGFMTSGDAYFYSKNIKPNQGQIISNPAYKISNKKQTIIVDQNLTEKFEKNESSNFASEQDVEI